MVETEDRRGNKNLAADLTAEPYHVTAAFIPQRSARAEVPGQQQINVYTMIVSADLADVGLWSIVRWRGELWDVVTPAAYHHGTRHTRHYSLDIRQRPS